MVWVGGSRGSGSGGVCPRGDDGLGPADQAAPGGSETGGDGRTEHEEDSGTHKGDGEGGANVAGDGTQLVDYRSSNRQSRSSRSMVSRLGALATPIRAKRTKNKSIIVIIVAVIFLFFLFFLLCCCCCCYSYHSRPLDSCYFVPSWILPQLYLLPFVPSYFRRIWDSCLSAVCSFLFSGALFWKVHCRCSSSAGAGSSINAVIMEGANWGELVERRITYLKHHGEFCIKFEVECK